MDNIKKFSSNSNISYQSKNISYSNSSIYTSASNSSSVFYPNKDIDIFTISEVEDTTNNISSSTKEAQEEKEITQTIQREVNIETTETSSFNYKYETSNKIAEYCQQLGFTEEQIDIAVAISRWETGNYTSNAFVNKNNVGGMKSNDSVITYSSQEEGIEAYVNNLKETYFDQGLDTVEKMASTYCTVETSNWINGIKSVME